MSAAKTPCAALLNQAVVDAELLAVYGSRNGLPVKRKGTDVTAEVLQGISNAREQFNKENLIGKAESAFLKYLG